MNQKNGAKLKSTLSAGAIKTAAVLSVGVALSTLPTTAMASFNPIQKASPSQVKTNNNAVSVTRPSEPVVIPNAVYLCDGSGSNKSCQYYETEVSIPLKEKFAKRRIMHDLLNRFVSNAVQKVDGKSNKNLSAIEMDIKGHLYRELDYVERSMHEKILEKYLIDVKIKPRPRNE